jgi:N4-(beta-N-acetylglucosaminyl)-L-asparaginase
MRGGMAPTAAAETAIRRIVKYYPHFSGAIIALNKHGQFGAACNGLKSFPFYVSNMKMMDATIFHVPCYVHH